MLIFLKKMLGYEKTPLQVNDKNKLKCMVFSKTVTLYVGMELSDRFCNWFQLEKQ